MEGENQDVIIPAVDDQEKQVLVEKFTGVACINCPAGSAVIEGLIETYNERLVAVSIHAGVFSEPYPENLYDFRVPEGLNIHEYVGLPQGYPSAVVDRKLFEGEADLQLFTSQWPGSVDTQMDMVPMVRIGVGKEFDTDSRQLDVGVAIHVDQTIEADDVRLSIAIIEDDVTDVQLTPDGKVEDYKHKHILRTMMTAFAGDKIIEPLNQGEVIERYYTITLSEDFVAENCLIVAYVNLGGENREVLQAEQVKIVE
jgi:hypothetical protein